MITKLTSNWCHVGSTIHLDGAGEDYTVREVGKDGVVRIDEKKPPGPTHPYCCVVQFEDGHKERIMNVNTVVTDKDGFR